MLRVGFVLAVAVLAAGCGGAERASPGEVSSQIRPGLQRELRKRTGDRTVFVGRIDCIVKSSSEARCVAHVDSRETSGTVPVDVDIDPETHDVIWRTTT